MLNEVSEDHKARIDSQKQYHKRIQSAIMIQKHFRGYRQRFLQIDELADELCEKQKLRTLNAIVKSWKTRLILNHENNKISSLKNEIRNIVEQANESSEINKTRNFFEAKIMSQLNQTIISTRRKQKVQELIDLLNELYKQPGIIATLLKEKRERRRQ